MTALISAAAVDPASANTQVLSVENAVRAGLRRPSVTDIQDAVCAEFCVSRSDLLSHRRHRDIARPRQVAMYLSRQLTSQSYPEIGRRFGGRDHTTVMHALKTVDWLARRDADLACSILSIAGEVFRMAEARSAAWGQLA